MPAVTTTVPAIAKTYALPLVRVRAKGAQSAFVLSTRFLGVWTHYWHGHTTPCTSPDCDACQHGHAATWHGYLALWNAKDQAAKILEFTAAAGQDLEDWLLANGSLRGSLLTASRAGNRPNGRVHLQFRPAAPTDPKLPPEPAILPMLAALWHMPVDAFTLPDRTNPNDHNADVNRAILALQTDPAA